MTRPLAVALSAGLFGLAFPPFGLDALAFVALVPLLLALRGAGPGRALALGFLWGVLATLLLIAWVVPTLRDHFEASLGFAAAFWLGLGLSTAAPYAAVVLAGHALAAPRLPIALRPLLFAAGWVAFEYARSELGLRSPWGTLAQSQAGAPALLPLAAFGGAYAVSACVAFGNAALAELAVALAARGPRLARAAGALAPALLLAAGLALAPRPADRAPAETLEIALVQGNVAPELRWRRSAASQVLRRYGELTRDLLAGGAPAGRPDLVVWPENALQSGLDDPSYGPPLRALARYGVPLLFGAPRSEAAGGARRHFTSAFLLRPDGRSEHYDKRRLLPFSETRPLGRLAGLDTPGDADAAEYSAGTRPGLFDVAGQRLGVLICVEALDAGLARELAAAGATVLVNLSNESWFGGRGGAEQHLQQAVLRAVENGLPMARATTSGVTALIAPDGRIVASLPAGRAGVLRAHVPAPLAGGTFYRRHGDVFAALCAACWAALAGRAAWRALARQARTGTRAARVAA